MGKCLIIGISGGSGSGKSTIANLIKNKYPEMTEIVCYDDYYKSNDGISVDERRKINYDSPDAFDNDLFLNDLFKLKNSEAIKCPQYDYTIHNRTNNYKVINPNSIIIADGIMLFHNKGLREFFDLKIYVDTSADIRLIRRIDRDMNCRGRTLKSVLTQYLKTVKPMHDKYVQPYKKYADIIINNDGYSDADYCPIFELIDEFLKKSDSF